MGGCVSKIGQTSSLEWGAKQSREGGGVIGGLERTTIKQFNDIMYTCGIASESGWVGVDTGRGINYKWERILGGKLTSKCRKKGFIKLNGKS